MKRERHPLVKAAAALKPLVRERADQIERDRRVPLDLVQAFVDAGIMRSFAPRMLGGGEIDPITYMEAIEAISEADGSAGWIAMIGSGSGYVLGFLDREVGGEIMRDPDTVLGGVFAPHGRAVMVDCGYLLSGRWPFGSGCEHSDWLVGGSIVFEGDRPRMDAEGRPEMQVMVFPQSAATIIDTWDVGGLRGSGSHDFEVQNLFVPASWSLTVGGVSPFHDGPLYRSRVFLYAHAGHALGVARGAIDTFTDLARRKPFGTSSGTISERPMVQAIVAQAESLVQAARAWTWQSARDVWETVCAGRDLTNEQRAMARLSITNAVVKSAEAVDLVYHAAGGSAVYARNRLERYFRDIHTATQHAVVAPSSYEQIGEALLDVGSRGVSPLTGFALL